MSGNRILYLHVSNPEMKAVVKKAIAAWRMTDSGFNIPLLETTVPAGTHGQKLSTSCFGAVLDISSLLSKTVPFLILPRSSTGAKTPLRLANSVGLIDSGYRGELLICVDNLSSKDFTIPAGSLLFQVCANDFMPFSEVRLVDDHDALPAAADGDSRGAGGFGSTG